jgi:D-glycero-alpha-D-manno-heptose 1-phosphate guanylyltransferase
VEAIVLAGGLGTRLRSVVSDLPKTMAPIHGRPFLAYLLDAMAEAGFDSIILAVGYKSEAIRAFFGDDYRGLKLRYSKEDEPLGTGGAIRLAMGQASAPHVFVLNGDTHLELDYSAMMQAHLEAKASLTIAIKQVPDAGRYGALETAEGRIRNFREKGRGGPGLINAGVYLLARDLPDRYPLPRIFSFETDLLMPHASELQPLAFETDGMFIDIGIPEDYARAQELLGAEGNRGSAPSTGLRTGFQHE